jgi:LmbE family N-acetylglucosaminyl deacetylase
MNARPLRLMAVLAHPDDESLGVGGALARYAAEGVAVHLVTATRGQRGRYFTNEDRPEDADVGRVREAELRAAAAVLGVRSVTLLDCMDGELDTADAPRVIERIADCIRIVEPHVVVTFDPFGAYGHPDHIAISQLATAAVVAASPHRVSKLYYFVNDAAKWDAYQTAFKTLVSRVDGTERMSMAWPDWSISCRVDASAHWPTVWRAVQCHETQMAVYGQLGQLTPAHHAVLWGVQTFYRAFSLVNGGRETENDLFAGLRERRTQTTAQEEAS